MTVDDVSAADRSRVPHGDHSSAESRRDDSVDSKSQEWTGRSWTRGRRDRHVLVAAARNGEAEAEAQTQLSKDAPAKGLEMSMGQRETLAWT